MFIGKIITVQFLVLENAAYSFHSSLPITRTDNKTDFDSYLFNFIAYRIALQPVSVIDQMGYVKPFAQFGNADDAENIICINIAFMEFVKSSKTITRQVFVARNNSSSLKRKRYFLLLDFRRLFQLHLNPYTIHHRWVSIERRAVQILNIKLFNTSQKSKQKKCNFYQQSKCI